jgi:hypothetical protein
MQSILFTPIIFHYRFHSHSEFHKSQNGNDNELEKVTMYETYCLVIEIKSACRFLVSKLIKLIMKLNDKCKVGM